MSSSDLTVVVMTRDRIDLLGKALSSVFDRQSNPPSVMVSDNSTREYFELNKFQQRYGFSYIRQSGILTATEHHNVCLQLPATRWVWLLHDDDELRSGAVRGVEQILQRNPRCRHRGRRCRGYYSRWRGDTSLGAGCK